MAAALKEPKEQPKIIVPERIVEPKRLPAVPTDASSMMKLIDRVALDPNFDPAKLAQLLEVKERWDKEEARKAFIAAMALFKADVPEILKKKGVSIPGGAVFSHAELGTVCDAVIPKLSKYGFAHRWEVTQVDRLITVSCLLAHELGHETRTTLQGAPDDSGKKNAIQQVGSTVTYLERYTLMAATGLAAKGMDNDGRGAGSDQPSMEEKKVADYLTSINDADDEDSLKRAFANAWNAAGDAKDKELQRRFMEARDKRRDALKKKGRP